MNRDEAIKKSYDFAADLAKQMITLSTAIITICVAFTGKVFTNESATENSSWLFYALIAFVISISLGIFSLMGLTGQLASTREENPAPTPPQTGTPASQEPQSAQTNAASQETDLGIYNSTNRCTSILQVIFFIIGLVLAIGYVYKASTNVNEQQSTSKPTGTELHIIRYSTYVIQDSLRTDTLTVVGAEPN